jgi:dipeptide/tripeptide permease
MAAFLMLFGLLTIKEGGSVLIGDPAALEAAGAYVPFVVWFNSFAGLAYLVAAIGLWRQERWAGAAAVIIAGATILVFAAFSVHIAAGGEYELRTVWAMALRSAVWTGVAILTCRQLGCNLRRAAA